MHAETRTQVAEARTAGPQASVRIFVYFIYKVGVIKYLLGILLTMYFFHKYIFLIAMKYSNYFLISFTIYILILFKSMMVVPFKKKKLINSIVFFLILKSLEKIRLVS